MEASADVNTSEDVVFKSPSGKRCVMAAQSLPGTPTYRTNGSDHLPSPKYPHLFQGSICVLSPSRGPLKNPGRGLLKVDHSSLLSAVQSPLLLSTFQCQSLLCALQCALYTIASCSAMCDGNPEEQSASPWQHTSCTWSYSPRANRLAVTDWLRTSWTQFTGVTARPCTHPSRTLRLGSTREEGITTHRSPKTPTALVLFISPFLVNKYHPPGLTKVLLCRVVPRQATVGTHLPVSMEDLVTKLAEVSVRQQHCFELLTEHQGQIQGYLADLRLSAAQNVPLPDPRVTAGRLLPKLTADDDIEAYLKMFESVAHTEGWARATVAAQRFHDWEFRPRVPARAQAADLMRLAEHWLLEGSPSPTQVAERVVVDHLLRALPRSMRQAAGMRGPKSLFELLKAVELADVTYHREAGERAPPFPRRVNQEPRPPEGTPRPVHRPSSPRDEPMPTDPPSPPTKTWMAGCVTTVKIKGRLCRALLDSGNAVSLVRPDTLGPRPVSKATIPITCVHGDTRQVHTNLLTFHKGRETWTLEVGVLKDLPVPLLLGHDWPGFEAALANATQPAQPRRHQRRAPSRGSESQSSMLTSDSGRDDESPSRDSNLFYDVFQQIKGGGDFGKAQKEDDRLKHCWGQVRILEGQEVLPPPHPLPHFVVQNGVAERRGEWQNGNGPLAGHLGAQNTVQRIWDRFHWPGLEAEVKRSFQACPVCQRTSPRKPPPSPLIPLPIIGVPFERIGMDIVGPLPRSGRGHEHILVIVDYATRYPEAVPLRRATSKAIARELFLLSSRVGLPSEILTDQGTPFMSRLMADLCRLLKVKQVRTSVYHPQTDGLVERFNQTLKQMLRKVAAEDKKDWDLLLPYVLFGVREVPQASTGFTPFELLFGRQPRGLLDIA
ncbi:Retrovirus-related Pol polyprotein [Labeo rohita]|uniref:Gypsy retrotransposon integrase-like protein 1 n=1 Tax=Labeo rohita TaxID=84645 RepID=A0ABQ8L369_LABRO|nr:Retrovirus-related Pol polyprotein [Labeo rohita]